MFAGAAPVFQALLAQPATLAIGAGLLAGAVTGIAVVASGFLSEPAKPQLALVSCPGNDAVVARVSSGQSTLVTARSADGAWLELYIGEPGVDRGWAPATALRFSASVDGLPVHRCNPLVAIASIGPAATGTTPAVTFVATVGPTSSLLPGQTPPPTPVPTATPKPTALPPSVTAPLPTRTPTPVPTMTMLPPPPPPPTSNPTPTPFVDNTPPDISGLVTTGQFYYNNNLGQNAYHVSRPSSGCPQPHAAGVYANVTDPDDAVASVVLRYWKPNAGFFDPPTETPMGQVDDNTWGGTITVLDSWTEGTVSYMVRATDQHGNAADQYYSLSYVLYVDTCIL